MTQVNANGQTKGFPLPAEIIPCIAIPIVTVVEKFVDLVKDRFPHEVQDFQHEIDFLLGRNCANSAEPVTYFNTEPTVPLDLHILGVVHSSPVKVVVCVETFGLSQKNIF